LSTGLWQKHYNRTVSTAVLWEYIVKWKSCNTETRIKYELQE